jgi:hypothetical protein
MASKGAMPQGNHSTQDSSFQESVLAVEEALTEFSFVPI